MHETRAAQNVFYVVGDKFEEFSVNPGTVTVSQLSRRLREGGAGIAMGALFLPGQGLRETDVEHLLQMVELLGLGGRYDFRLRNDGRRRASRVYTHKHRPENSIVSIPRRAGDDVFELDLLLDEHSELMNDHQTGQHIQGMVLIEAARQAFLAVTEAFFVTNEPRRSYYFVINSIVTNYHSFVFPLESTIRYHVLEKKIEDPARLQFHVNIEFLQADQCATSIEVRFTAFDAERLRKREAARAQSTVEWYCTRAEEMLLRAHHGATPGHGTSGAPSLTSVPAAADGRR